MSFLRKGFLIGNDEINILFNVGLALIAGFIIAAGYVIGNRSKKYSKNFTITIFFLPVIMTVVIPFIATDLKKAVSLAGVFALVRFRSIPGDSKDILYIFFTLAVGIILALNSYVIAFAITFIISILYVVIKLNWKASKDQVLKITIPEDMNYNGAFDDIFKKYLKNYSFSSVKTSNMGTLFTVSYNVRLNNIEDAKALIDELRTRNGNLNIILCDESELQTQTL
ncbi:MAG: DUF4956 domain-containing protein [Treponema sp.]|nr:DUF4956 domain-containing protein [Treponema sp.]